jgi:hypothetical protein
MKTKGLIQTQILKGKKGANDRNKGHKISKAALASEDKKNLIFVS